MRMAPSPVRRVRSRSTCAQPTQLTCSAYGALIGTFLVTSFFEMALSFVPPKKLRMIFPPIVTVLTVCHDRRVLIGKSGFLNWGGGTNGCAPPSGRAQHL